MQRAITITSGLFSFLKYFIPSAIFIMAPVLAISLDGNIKQIQATVGTYFTSTMIGMLLIAPLGDKFQKHRIMMILSLLIFTGSIITITATTYEQFISGIFILGFSITPSIIIIQAYIQNLLHQKKKVAASLSIIIAISYAGSLLGMIFGGYMADYGKWQYAFLFISVIAISCWVLSAKLIKKETQLIKKSVAKEFLNYWLLLKCPHFFFIAALNGIISTTLCLFSIGGIYLLNKGLHYPLHIIGYSAIGFAIGGIIGSTLVFYLRQKIALHILILLSNILCILAALTYFILSFYFTPGLLLTVFLISIYVIGLSAIGTLSKTTVMSRFPKISSSVNSMNSIFASIFNAIVTFLGALVLHHTHSLWLASAILMMALLSILCFMGDRLAIKYHNLKNPTHKLTTQ